MRKSLDRKVEIIMNNEKKECLPEIERTFRYAKHTANMLKLIAHPHRLMILCLLAESERNVTELVREVGINQTAVSNHLAKLRRGGAVDYTRYHRVLQYRLVSPEVRAVLDTISRQCLDKTEQTS